MTEEKQIEQQLEQLFTQAREHHVEELVPITSCRTRDDYMAYVNTKLKNYEEKERSFVLIQASKLNDLMDEAEELLQQLLKDDKRFYYKCYREVNDENDEKTFKGRMYEIGGTFHLIDREDYEEGDEDYVRAVSLFINLESITNEVTKDYVLDITVAEDDMIESPIGTIKEAVQHVASFLELIKKADVNKAILDDEDDEYYEIDGLLLSETDYSKSTYVRDAIKNGDAKEGEMMVRRAKKFSAIVDQAQYHVERLLGHQEQFVSSTIRKTNLDHLDEDRKINGLSQFSGSVSVRDEEDLIVFLDDAYEEDEIKEVLMRTPTLDILMIESDKGPQDDSFIIEVTCYGEVQGAFDSAKDGAEYLVNWAFFNAAVATAASGINPTYH